mmetsp:Transcript_15637/g.39804  ORF Transcript_15637/g.39804 Transcript_15637/m.39804 type:complete len:197 (+) Transcript_15637:998-1588(+)
MVACLPDRQAGSQADIQLDNLAGSEIAVRLPDMVNSLAEIHTERQAGMPAKRRGRKQAGRNARGKSDGRPPGVLRTLAPMAVETDGLSAEVLRALENASVLVGMHPDQATEPLVRAALRLDIPFAVVPCCTFAALNSHRKMAAGQGVVSHKSLCAYLAELDPQRCVQGALLPFAGRNRLLYRANLRCYQADYEVGR